MKQGIEYFNMLSEDDKIKYKTNSSHIEQFLNDQFDSFENFIKCSFVWRLSKEGYDYWRKLSISKNE